MKKLGLSVHGSAIAQIGTILNNFDDTEFLICSKQKEDKFRLSCYVW